LATAVKIVLLLVVLGVAGFGAIYARSAAAARGVIVDKPEVLAKTRNLLEALADAHKRGKPLHILFVHGIRATGDGYSGDFADRLTAAIGGTKGMPKRVDLPPLPWPRNASMAGAPPGEPPAERTVIWPDRASWNRSQPFVMRTKIASDRGDVTIDEVNYWPLLFPLKCRFLLVPEHDLSGNDRTNLEHCRERGWLSQVPLDRLLNSKPQSKGGARLNAIGKQQILNWGLSDAVIALGPMRRYLNDAIEKACELAMADGPDDEYVIFAESLGSFVVLDAFAANQQSVKDVVNRTNDLYLLANQFALLELARIDGIPTDSQRGASLLGDAAGQPADPPSPLAVLGAWGRSATPNLLGKPAGQPRQIIAFSDPSDLLTYRLPALEGVKVVNVYDRQGFDFLGLFADPLKAHTGHVDNPAVWRVLLGKR